MANGQPIYIYKYQVSESSDVYRNHSGTRRVRSPLFFTFIVNPQKYTLDTVQPTVCNERNRFRYVNLLRQFTVVHKRLRKVRPISAKQRSKILWNRLTALTTLSQHFICTYE